MKRTRSTRFVVVEWSSLVLCTRVGRLRFVFVGMGRVVPKRPGRRLVGGRMWFPWNNV